MVRLYLCVPVLLLPLTMTSAVGTTDFSGSYTLTPAKHASNSGKDMIETLAVVQTANAIEITRVVNGESESNEFRLDGREEACHNENRTGICKGHMKGSQLFLSMAVTIRIRGNLPPIIFYSEERWQLSPDSRTLKIRREVVAPLSPVSSVDPWTDVYTRN
jgi:hypothetical protein